MEDSQTCLFEAAPIELTLKQRQVVEILRSAKSQKYSLGDWYLGAIYAAKNTYNPDRYSQASQSLRELLEKLPRVFVETAIQESKLNFIEMRNNLYLDLCSAKNRYEGKWKGKTIDTKLAKIIENVYKYIELTRKPGRGERINTLINNLDPMCDNFGQEMLLEKSRIFNELWKAFESFAHHGTIPDDEVFWDKLAKTEHLIIDLLAPITAQDQRVILSIITKQSPNKNDVAVLINLIKRRGANYAFFFKNADNPMWISPLAEYGFFKNPPSIAKVEDDLFITPFWWPIHYLHKVSIHAPSLVVDVILGMEETENPRILSEIFLIACELPDVNLSVRLKPMIKQFLKSPYRWGGEDLVVLILQKWGYEPGLSRNAAHEIMQTVVAFQADPKEDEKKCRRKESPVAWDTLLEPVPRFQSWEYKTILDEGVRPLIDYDPYPAALILIDATVGMFKMSMHIDEIGEEGDGDFSEFLCCRLDSRDSDADDVSEILIYALVYACEQVFKSAQQQIINNLDNKLRIQRWKIFKRLRQHLYALKLDRHVLPFIREFILDYKDYSSLRYSYEFQLMSRKATEYFGAVLLNNDERERIFSSIISGPSRMDFIEKMGDDFTEDGFIRYRRSFHSMQLRPFAALLEGRYKMYFEELVEDAQIEPIADDSYLSCSGVVSGAVSFRSPKSVEELDVYTDEDLLDYLNNWDEECRDKDNWLVEFNISALAGVFQTLFKEKIVQDGKRLTFWLEHRDDIARPVYVESMVKSIQELVSVNDFRNLNCWIDLCLWVLSHADSKKIENQPEPQDISRKYPCWGSSRRAVVDFIDVCVDNNAETPINIRDGLFNLLRNVCNQPDSHLDYGRSVLRNRDDPLFEAINNTRSRALISLLSFGYWIRRYFPEDPLLEVTNILSKRMGEDAELALTRPEHALLGKHFTSLCSLSRDFAISQLGSIFPRENISSWLNAFGAYICYNKPYKTMFDILHQNFEFALESIKTIINSERDESKAVDCLGQHLFLYYIWNLYPLTGDDSLLEKFYNNTKDEHKFWLHIFRNAGSLLRKCGEDLDDELIGRATAYFDWRLSVSDPLELQGFTVWLNVQCLDPEWRLRAYILVIDVIKFHALESAIDLRVMNSLVSDNLALVVECFAKITDYLNKDTRMNILPSEAIPILRAGLTAKDFQVRQNAERAKENCLRHGRLDFLDVEQE